jgi:hypothetical protein
MKDQPGRPAGRPRLTVWEKRIIAVFIERYPGSAAAAIDVAAGDAATAVDVAAAKDGVSTGTALSASPPAKAPRPLRLKPDRIVPGIDQASPDDRESFLEAAESLEGRGLLSLIWARHRKGEILSALVCRNPELLYELTGKNSPKTIAEDVRKVARSFVTIDTILEKGRRDRAAKAARKGPEAGETVSAGTPPEETALFAFLAENFTSMDAAGGIDVTAVLDLVHLVHFLFDRDEPVQGKVRGLTTRALSTTLYGDSKRLEALMNLFNPLFVRARRREIVLPDLSFLDRSFPETYIAGKIAFDFADDPAGGTSRTGNGAAAGSPENAAGDSRPRGPAPLVNAVGAILSLPLETILKIRRIRPLAGEAPADAPAGALMIENKETFFALSQALPALPGYACFLYVGGHPNRAVRALVSLLAGSGFALSHAGDLDPDGILILQELAEMAGKEVRPLRMDAATFDTYLECGRPLEPSTLKRTALISEKTRALPGMAELIRRMEETGMGVEQEIVDYRE